MHNNFIQLAVDTGFFGLATWLGTCFYFFRLLYKQAFGVKKDLSGNWTVFGSAAAAIGFLADGCFESNFYDSEVSALL